MHLPKSAAAFILDPGFLMEQCGTFKKGPARKLRSQTITQDASQQPLRQVGCGQELARTVGEGIFSDELGTIEWARGFA